MKGRVRCRTKSLDQRMLATDLLEMTWGRPASQSHQGAESLGMAWPRPAVSTDLRPALEWRHLITTTSAPFTGLAPARPS